MLNLILTKMGTQVKTTEKAVKTVTTEKVKTSKTLFGHVVGTQAGAIDQFLLSAKKAMTLAEIAEQMKLPVPRIKSHVAHLIAVKKQEFETADGKYLLIVKKVV